MRAWGAIGASAGLVAALGASGVTGCAAGADSSPLPPSGGYGVGAGPVGGGGGTGLTGAGGAGGDPCAGPELCDGIDNDCDSQVDEGCSCTDGETQPCYSGDPTLLGIGVCAEGTQTCDLNGQWGDCEGEGLPSAESCNGQDDDCDDEVDEQLGDVVCGLGICQVTVPACTDGEPVPCVPTAPAPPEDCEGTDDDCDGVVDEDCPCVDGQTQPCYTGTQQTREVGECHDGLQTCNDQGIWGSCEGDQIPVNELCNGLDDDCDGTDDDGNPESGGACTTGLPGVCAPGTRTCRDGQLECDQNVQPSADLCDGQDNDCSASTADGSGDPAVNVACDGTDSDLCIEGVTICNGSHQVVCNDTSSSTLDLCNGGVDDDCDPSSADGSEDPAVNTSCDGPDSDLCNEGVIQCTNGVLGCTDNTNSSIDVCNGLDDDCDPTSADGSEGAQAVGAACDGTDTDLCIEGVYTCSNGSLGCTDTTGNSLDVCDGADNDCNPATTDGSQGAQAVGIACDGADSDLCTEGGYTCSNGTLGCSDTSSSNLDVCNGVDDDCDASSADGSEGSQAVGIACDGTDSDLCKEGSYTCSNGALGCSDTSSSNLDVCNGLDDDCDPSSGDGSEGAQAVGLPCDGPDTDLCVEGGYTCSSGSLGCTDTSTSTAEACNGDAVDEDCDGQVDEGFTRDDSPTCPATPWFLGSISGDTGSGASFATDSYYNEEWDRVRVTEDNNGIVYLSARVELYSPPGVDFDLYVHCDSCGGSLRTSTVTSTSGHWDIVEVRNGDDWGSDDDFDLIIEVRHKSSTRCAYWDLAVYGDLAVTSNYLDCD